MRLLTELMQYNSDVDNRSTNSSFRAELLGHVSPKFLAHSMPDREAGFELHND